MKIKDMLLRQLKDIDIRLFCFLKNLFFKNRLKAYILLFLIIIVELSLRLPYLNIFILAHKEVINVSVIPLVLVFIIGFNGRRIFMVSVALFFPLAALTLIGKEVIAEQLANVIYGFLSIGIVMMVVQYTKGKDEIQKIHRKN